MSIYYVSTTGSDGSSGNIDSPFRTISHAMAQDLKAGDEIVVAPGTYEEAVNIYNGGSPAGHVTLRSEVPGAALIRGPSDSPVVVDISANYVAIEGFDITGSGGKHGISGDRVHHIEITDNIVHNNGASGISFAYSEFLTIEGNTTHSNASNGWFSGISVWQNLNITGDTTTEGYRTIVRNNISYDNITDDKDGLIGGHSDGNGIIIDDFQNTQNYFWADPTEERPSYTYPTLVENNLVYNNGGKGIQVFYSDGVTVKGNTAYHNNQDTVNQATWRGELSNSMSSNNTWINNIAVTDPSVNGNNRALDNTSYNGYVNENIAWQNNLSFDGTPGSASINADGGNASPSVGDGNLLGVDPGFVGSGWDFRLSSDSPAINAGTESYGYSPTDLGGGDRSVGTIDIGAYEYGGEATTPSMPTTPETGDVDITIRQSWDGGFSADLVVTPPKDSASWSVTLKLSGQGSIASDEIWGVGMEDLGGGYYRFGADWVDSAGQAKFSFTARGETDGIDESSVIVDSQAENQQMDASSEGYDARAEVVETWPGGFKAEVTIVNDGTEPLSGWSLTLGGGTFDIYSVWGAAVGGDGTVLEGVASGPNAWGHTIQPGQSMTVGFAADGPVPNSLTATPLDGDVVDPVPEPTPDAPPSPGQSGSDPNSPFDASDYAEAANLSMSFFYANYAGDLPDEFHFDWRGDSTLDDGADVGRDLSGGWFDAGDHVKFGLPMAATATLLAWGGDEFADGYKQSGAIGDLEQHLRFVNDYFLQAYDDRGTAAVSDDVLHVQVGHGPTDHAYWGSPEDMDVWRPTYSVDASKPGSDVAGETAAAFAASSIFFREQGDGAYADRLLGQAEKLFDFAETYQGKYSDSVPEANPYYTSVNGYRDELAWAATFLHEATGDQNYLDKAESYYSGNWWNGAIQFDNKENSVALRLAEATGNERYLTDIDRHLDHWVNDIARTPGTETNAGMGWLTEWGSAVLAANTGFLATIRAKDLAETAGGDQRVDELRSFATDQMDYILGDNPSNYSYLIGFGDDFPLSPHHRAASGTTNMGDTAPNVHELTGALVGGPSQDGSFEDDRLDWVRNEVGTTYNAGFSGLAAGLVEGLTDSGDGGWFLG